MKRFTKAGLVLASCTLATVGFASAPAQAQDWDYAIDSFNDGYNLGVVGANSSFEFYGLAMKTTADQVFVAINSNLALEGEAASGAADGHIGYGDLFLNFTGNNRAQAEGNDLFFGIRFAQNSDSGAAELGVYQGVTSQDTTKTNSGFWDIDAHRSYVAKKGGTASFGDLDWKGDGNGVDDYFGSVYRDRTFANSIASGTKVGDIALLSAVQLSGLDFQQFGATGNHTFGFSFSRDLLPADGGDFIAHLVAECLNDGIALLGNVPALQAIEDPGDVEETPEPTLLVGLVLLGGAGLLKRLLQPKVALA